MKSWWKNTRGVAALEYAILMPFLLIAILGAIDVAMETMMDASLDRGAAAAARIGLTVTAPTQNGVPITEDQQIFNTVWAYVGIWLQGPGQLTITTFTYPSYQALNQAEPCLTPGYTGPCTGTQGTGGFGSIVRYQVTIHRPTFTGLLGVLNITSYTLQRTLIVQNEPQSS
jgi:Flp pilus assembly protein TadG